jgi:aminobenzoyl-glutamate utilization protein B
MLRHHGNKWAAPPRDVSRVCLIGDFSMKIENRLVTVIVFAFALSFTAASGQQNSDAYKKEALASIDGNRDVMTETARHIWEFAETALMEYKSSRELSAFIEARGFNVQRGVAGLPTAFVATYGSGKPVIGILGEFDALPGLSQKPGLPRKEAVAEGEPGHGCGHNLFGVASAAAAVAVKDIMARHNLRGTIKFFGCPAEETVVGKVYMAKEGLFNDLDICLDWHPDSENEVSLDTSNALNNFEVTFTGKTAHAAGDPWDGRSALDAVELMDVGVNFLREHVRPTVRIHYVIPEAGKAPNVVPDHARVWYFVRGKDRAEVDEVYERVLKIAEGASLMSGTTHEVYLITGVYNKLVNHEVAGLLHRNLEFVGAPQFTEPEHAFAREIQKYLGKKEDGMAVKIKPLEEPKGYSGGGSTDVADVSWIVPTASLGTACWPLESPGHSWAVATCSGSSTGFKGMLVAAKTIAASGIEALQNPGIIEKARAEFTEKTKGFTYKSAVPPGQKPRLPKELSK